MSPYALTIYCLGLALIAQSASTVVALRVALRQPYRRSWLALAVAAGLLGLHFGYALDLALFSGIYDLPQGVLSLLVAALLALGLFGASREVRRS